MKRQKISEDIEYLTYGISVSQIFLTAIHNKKCTYDLVDQNIYAHYMSS